MKVKRHKNPIFEQRYLEGETLSENEVETYLESRGFVKEADKPVKSYSITIDGTKYVVSDFSDNFIRDLKGNVYAIDAGLDIIDEEVNLSESKDTEESDLPFQASEERFKPISPQEGKALLELLSKNGLAKDIRNIQELLEEIKNKYGEEARTRFLIAWHGGRDKIDNFSIKNTEQLFGGEIKMMSTPKGEVYGAVKNGIVYLDFDKLNSNTPIHEFGHLWNDFVMAANKPLWGKGVELAKQSEYWEKIAKNPTAFGLPKNATENQIANEVLARLYGNRGEAITQEKGLKEKLSAWIQEVWEWLGSKLGIRDLSADQIQNLTLKQFVDGAIADMLSGNAIKINTEIANQKKYDFDVSGITESNAQEMQRIKAEAQANGTFMQSPNGKPTNLNERQWLQVRTAQFKKWFGDWELANKLQMIEDLATIGIVPHSYDIKELEQIYNNTQNVGNKYDNRKVSFSHSVFGKMRRFGTDGNFAKIVPQLKDIFDNSVPIYSEQEQIKDGHKQHPNLVGYHNYLGKVNIEGKDYYVRFTVQEHRTTEEKKEARIPNELHNTFVSDVEIYNAAKTEITGLGTTEQVTVSGIKIDAKLQQFFETAREARDNSSKVVDANGEPMVVYHGSPNEFTKFTTKNKYIWTTNPVTGQKEKHFWSVIGSLGEGSYFTYNKDYAEEFSDNGGILYETFLNIRNPYRGRFDGTQKDMIQAGYDGAQGVNFEEDIYMAVSPSQIKSSTSNNGNFDELSDDIRYQENVAAQEYFRTHPDRLPLTLSVFERAEFKAYRGKNIRPNEMAGLLNLSGIKAIEKELIKGVIKANYPNSKTIPYDEFEAAVRANIIPLDKIESESYATYGSSNLWNQTPDNAYTLILNMPEVEHGKQGHFSGEFKTKNARKIDYVPRQLDEKTWVAVDAKYMESGANEANIISFVGTADNSKE
ncbi:MAG: hypothetical protein LBE13_18775, partial [Bacteroidales bacterium]|nr:hypothetical protein [Bacteroidales bacterium]